MRQLIVRACMQGLAIGLYWYVLRLWARRIDDH